MDILYIKKHSWLSLAFANLCCRNEEYLRVHVVVSLTCVCVCVCASNMCVCVCVVRKRERDGMKKNRMVRGKGWQGWDPWPHEYCKH